MGEDELPLSEGVRALEQENEELIAEVDSANGLLDTIGAPRQNAAGESSQLYDRIEWLSRTVGAQNRAIPGTLLKDAALPSWVWVLTYDADGPEVIGVFGTKEEAFAFCRQDHDPNLVWESDTSGNVERFASEGIIAGFYLERWLVRPQEKRTAP